MKGMTKLILQKLEDPKTYAADVIPDLIIDTIKNLEEKLPKVELYAKMGGFIQDRNGKICKHGDSVLVYRYGAKETAYLTFDHKKRCFTVRENDGKIYPLDEREFELVEQSEKIDI